jgi:hypothetical protein
VNIKFTFRGGVRAKRLRIPDLDGHSREVFPRDCLLGDQRRGMKLRVDVREGQLRI